MGALLGAALAVAQQDEGFDKAQARIDALVERLQTEKPNDWERAAQWLKWAGEEVEAARLLCRDIESRLPGG